MRKPKFWQDQMQCSGADNIYGEVRLADVSSEVNILYRWQAYSDSPVAGLELVRQVDGHQAIQMLLSHPGVESEARAIERKVEEAHAEQEHAREHLHGFSALHLPGTPGALSASSGGSSLWFLDGSSVGHIASIGGSRHQESRIEAQHYQTTGAGEVETEGNGRDAEKELVEDGWNAQEIWVRMQGPEQASRSAEARETYVAMCLSQVRSKFTWRKHRARVCMSILESEGMRACVQPCRHLVTARVPCIRG